MFSTLFIEQAQDAFGKEKESTSVTIEFGSTFFVISKVPLEEESSHLFQGHIGEGETTLFVYLKGS